MLSWIAPKIAMVVAGALFVIFSIYFINDYFNLRTAYKLSQQTISILEHRRQVLDAELMEVERQQNINYVRQHDALLEMSEKGYISTNTNLNPEWMRSQAPGDSKSKDSIPFSR